MTDKKIVLFLLSIPLLAKTNFNINLSIPVNAGDNYKSLRPLGCHNNSCNKAENKVEKESQKTIENSSIKKQNNYKPYSNYKIVKSDVVKQFELSSKYDNVCSAFVIDNSDKAFDFGYTQGVKYTKLYIGKFLLKYKRALDILFPLKDLYLNGGILQPPLIEKVDKDSSIYGNGEVYRQFGVKYYIKEPARFVKRGDYKKWEDFLLDYPVEYYKKQKLDNILNFTFKIKYSSSDLCNKRIRKSVYKNFREGFLAGEKEVFELMKTRLEKIRKFLDSLYLYNDLYYKGIINPPLISEFIEPVYKNRNGKSLIINEKVLKIVKPASFNTNTKNWKVFLIRNDKIILGHIKLIK